MNLIIQKISVTKKGKTESLNFNKRLSVVKGSAELYDIIKLLIGRHEAGKTFYDFSFSAEVVLDRTYHFSGTKGGGEDYFTFEVECDGKDAKKEYFEAIKCNEESDSTLFFHHFKRQNYPHRLLHYKDLFKYYPDGNFDSITNGYGSTRSFRGFMTQYIRNFKPIKLREGKEIYLKLSALGRFSAGYKNSDEKVVLSEAENTLLHYFSFIFVADFWGRAERIRNMNTVNKPLIVSTLLEKLDESVNLDTLLKKTNRLDRQTILFTLREHKPNIYDIYC